LVTARLSRAPQARERPLGGLHPGGRAGVLRLPPAAEGEGTWAQRSTGWSSRTSPS